MVQLLVLHHSTQSFLLALVVLFLHRLDSTLAAIAGLLPDMPAASHMP